MTVAKNDEIHTCKKCGAKRYELDSLSILNLPDDVFDYMALGLLFGLLLHAVIVEYRG